MDTLELDAQLHAAEAAVIQAQQQKLQAEALLRQRRSELVTARVDFERVSQLADNGFSSQARLDGQRTVLDTAKAAVAAAEASVERLQALIDDATLTEPRAGRRAGAIYSCAGRRNSGVGRASCLHYRLVGHVYVDLFADT